MPLRRSASLVATIALSSFALLQTGCASTQCPPTSSATSAPARSSSETPNAKDTNGPATKRSAEEVIAAFERAHPLSAPNEPLRKPASLDDVDAIMHLDQMDLFAGAAAYAETQPGVDALALRAQIELSHSEAQLLVAEVLHGASSNLAPITRALQFRSASGSTSAAERTKLAELSAAQGQAEDTEAALRELAGAHARAGAELARRVIASSPTGHRGYRIAADYHRLRGDWPAFEEAVSMLAKARPSSNGLVFLRALEAQAEGDSTAAAKLLQAAVVRDQRFVRAQAHLVLLQRSPAGAHDELSKLRVMNPHHQLVVFAGALIDAANDEWRASAPAPGPRDARSL